MVVLDIGMFDGTDLSLAYGSEIPEYAPKQPMAPSLQPPAISQVNVPVVQQPPAVASHAVAPEVPYNPPEAMYAKQPGAPPASHMGGSFWDRLAQKKAEVFKMFVLSLVVLLGISMDRLATHYLNAYVSRSFLTEMQEVLVRVAYPVFIVLVLWILKAMY